MDPEIDKEGLTRRDRFFNEDIGAHRVFVDRHLLAGAIKSTVFIITIFSRSGRIGDHVIGEVPLPIVRSGVARLLKHLRKSGNLGIKPVRHATFGIAGNPGKMAVDGITCGKVPRHHRGTTRGTNSAGHGEAMEIGAFFGKAVDIGRLDIRMSVTTKITPPPVISEDKENIRTSRAFALALIRRDCDR